MHHHHSATCHHHHHSQIAPQTKQFQLLFALLLIGGFAVAELVVGLMSHSLVLVADAGHMVSDGFALLLALIATWAAQLPVHKQGWLGNPQLESWAALINSIALSAIALWIGWEAIDRLQTPSLEIASQPLLITAAIGAVVNGINVAMLHRGSDVDLNLRAAFLHVLADAMSCVGVILAAIAVAAFHWYWADGAISLFVAGLILIGAIPVMGQGLSRVLRNNQIQEEASQ